MQARIYISAAHKSSGKTTLSIGLSAAFSRKGLTVQCFKKGPDYIDPKWLEKATQRPCYNLDFHTMAHKEITDLFASYSRGADFSLIEGNKGLYDGVDIQGLDSNAALVKLLAAPVILVIDCSGITRGVAPLLQGYEKFDTDLQIAGVILNKVASERHEQKLRAVVEYYTDIPVLGVVRKNPDLEIKERHLGLIPSNEEGKAEKIISTLAKIVSTDIDLDTILEIGTRVQKLPYEDSALNLDKKARVRIGIFRDAAFGFYYPDDLESLQKQGAELVFINALEDKALPEIDGLFIGGGFPETQAEKLAANQTLRNHVKTQIENGLPVYAECGGLMYLTRNIQWAGRSHEMAGVLQADTVMSDRPAGRGYAKLQRLDDALWSNDFSDYPKEVPAHEFHYSRLENIDQPLKFAYKVLRGTGIDGKHDGIVYKNLLASYTHLRDTSRYHWTQHFLEFVRNRNNR
ncbi:MAG TPA: hydrogenobyrinic acid a,c-diamide synthase (glutamine-hydrolyzing) [Chromatiales bacterium]|nr:hydrogenobyrinic acid a,c-diamide synthase (glutamine-hydrolyzing) [Thiotrichales bacterium]HIP68462.1 hydrogenobyrinic acid a,c-diamide synthase (glutamine-hydrolyzing) [Chromatiales bacterium]